ncbi:MAG: carbohydrate binding family 9 domain-containing protein [Candidatus Zixiibacteriota bacterium]|nr:MAG: carbohydrate binding family 9 domain-containing protein [candidate division Zixibacteria bacterium]
MSRVKSTALVVFCLLVLTVTPISASVADEQYVPQFHPTMKAHQVRGEIKIDGDLGDRGWQGAQPARNFTEHSPGEEVAPPVRTEAFVAFDDKNLYLAAVCYADPATVRASMCERERIFDDDNIGFFFDTYGDATRAYIININPYGIPYDALWSAGWGEDSNFDLIFESAGKVTDSGYQVELAIPFSNLRFPNKPTQEWKIDFYRHHQREVHYSMSWATYDPDEPCWPCKWGTVTGIADVKPGKGIELLPSFVAHQSGVVTNSTFPDTSFSNGDIYGDFSIGGKYALSSDVLLEATYNPDFSQIEADASQVDVNTTFALSYDERRPFFQEGIDVFRTNFNAVYTRSINDPDYAAKASAKFGRTSVAALSAHDEQSLRIMPFEEWSAYVPLGETYTNMVAARHAFGDDNHVRALVTDQRIEGGGSGTLTSLDGRLSLTKSLAVRGQFMATHTSEPDDTSMTAYLEGVTFDDGKHTAAYDGESFWGTAGLVGLVYDSRRFWMNVRTYQRTATYRAANGYQPRNNDRWVIGNFGYNYRPKGTIIYSIDPGLELGRIYNFDGLRKDEWVRLSYGNLFRFAQASIWLEYLRSRERYGGTDFRDIWAFTCDTDISPLKAVQGGINVTYGNQIARNFMAMGRQTSVSAWLDIRPTDRLLIENGAAYTKSRDADTNEEYFEGYILHTRVGYQFSRELSLRLVGEYNDFSERWSLDPLITYRINAFSTFYAGATYDYSKYHNCGFDEINTLTCLSQRQFFMKLQYLFQT